MFRYIYPPRPETTIPAKSLSIFENMNKFLAQPKLNGSSMEIYTDGSSNGSSISTMNRHNEAISCKMNNDELIALHKGIGLIVLCGEYMNKNQRDENKNPWNIKYVIWDIIVFNGEHLLGTTFKERYELLVSLYP